MLKVYVTGLTFSFLNEIGKSTFSSGARLAANTACLSILCFGVWYLDFKISYRLLVSSYSYDEGSFYGVRVEIVLLLFMMFDGIDDVSLRALRVLI